MSNNMHNATNGGRVTIINKWDAEPEDAKRLLQVERRVFATGWLPNCMCSKAYDCYDCPLEGMPGCPVRVDPDYRSLLLYMRDRYLAYERKRIKQIKVLKAILKRHKLPLHWENLATLAFKEAPDLFESAYSVRSIVVFTPDTFRMEEGGVISLVGVQNRV